jgi:hypothetical protein
MFKDKKGSTAESKPITKAKMIMVLVNMVDVNVTTWSKTSEDRCSKIESQKRINLQQIRK